MRAIRFVGSLLALLAVLAAGLWIGGHPSAMPEPLRAIFVDDAAGLTAEASELIEDNYFRTVVPEELTDGSLQGMVRKLRRTNRDRFSEYFPPAILAHFNEEIEGRFSGVGMSVSGVPRGLFVVRVFEDSPAERGGIKAGDTILSVDGRSLAGVSADRATNLIKGPEGTDVVLGVRAGEGGKRRRVTLERAQIAVPVVDSRIERADGRKLGYVYLAAFSRGAHGPLREAVEDLQRRGGEGIVLDLRANGGGLLEEAVLSASIFLPKGEVVVRTDSRTQGSQVYKAQGGNLPLLPMVVLIDRGTASAAEILAAALVDQVGARTVGARSFGKGVFQQEIGLSNGGALKLTVGEYFTPGGENLAGEGIDPQVRARDLPATPRDEAVDRALNVLAGQV